MYTQGVFNTLHQAYSGYFDDVSLPSTTATPLGVITSTVPQDDSSVPASAPVKSNDSTQVHRRPSTCYIRAGNEEHDRREYIQLTQLQFALLCMAAGVAVGLLVAHRLRV
jgi:hypothetical protein